MMMVYTIFVQDVCTRKISKRQRSSLRFGCRIGLESIARGRTRWFGFFWLRSFVQLPWGYIQVTVVDLYMVYRSTCCWTPSVSSSSWRGSLRLRLGSFALTGLRLRRLRFVALHSKRYHGAAAINQSVFVDWLLFVAGHGKRYISTRRFLPSCTVVLDSLLLACVVTQNRLVGFSSLGESFMCRWRVWFRSTIFWGRYDPRTRWGIQKQQRRCKRWPK